MSGLENAEEEESEASGWATERKLSSNLLVNRLVDTYVFIGDLKVCKYTEGTYEIGKEFSLLLLYVIFGTFNW